MASSDYPMGSMSPTEDSIYPDIDESLQYPWQGEQQPIAEELPEAVIDPRLYQGSFSQHHEPTPGQVEQYEDDEADDLEQYDGITDEVSDDSEYNTDENER